MTEGNDAHVHHLLIYLCEGLNDTHVGNGGDCEGNVANEVAECRGGTIIAAWAVGGEVCLSSCRCVVDVPCSRPTYVMLT